ncbi:MAG: Acg family FMN-binding oxidoreductase [Pseudomonadota bacterium]
MTIDERMRRILESAGRAPSSHNTQPWLFEPGPDGVRLHADRRRALPVNDPEDRELVISCGCALMNLRVAAAAEGLGVEVAVLPEPEDPDLLAAVRVGKGGAEAGLAPLAGAVPRRVTHRKRFDGAEVPDAVMARIEEAAAVEGARLRVIREPAAREAAAGLVAEGDRAQWADPRWRRELAAWLHPRRRGDGLSVPGLLAPAAALVVRSFDMGGGVAAKDRDLAAESPVMAVLGTEGDGPADWLRAGQGLERALLVAVGAGLQASYLNQPIQTPRLRPKLQQIVPEAGLPQILLRLGPVKDAGASDTPRRLLDEMLASAP